MDKIVSVIFTILFAVSFSFAQNAEVSVKKEKIEWERDYEKALKLAKETNKPLMLDFTAKWCGPCNRMDAEFWVLDDVIQATQPFIAVKVDFDSKKGLVSKYGVSAIPYVVFTDPLGNMITARTGFSSKKISELNQIFDEMPKDFSPLKKFYDALELKEDDGIALLRIADAYRAAKMVRLSSEFYKKSLKTREIQTNVEYREGVMTVLGVNAFDIKDFERATDYMEDYLKAYPAGKNKELAVSILAIAYARRGKMKNANKYFEILKAEFPASKNIRTAAGAIDDAKNGGDIKSKGN